MNKKAEMGIGTLIIFIAMILVAAIAAGVLLQTAGSLQNKALLTGERSKSQVSTSVSVLQVYAEDGTIGKAHVFCSNLKLQPGSDPIKFDDMLVNFDTDNMSADKNYGNMTDADITCSRSNAHVNTGGSTSKYLSSGENCNAIVNSGIDFDGDGVYDNLSLNRSGNGLVIEVSNGSKPAENVTITLLNEKNTRIGVNETVYNLSDEVNITVFDADVNDSKTSQWGAISIIAWNVGASTNMTIDSTKSYIIGAGNQGTSGYSVRYLVQGSSYESGYLNRGDVVRLCYTAPRIVTEDEDVSITFVPKTGSITKVETAMPEIFSQKRVYVYP